MDQSPTVRILEASSRTRALHAAATDSINMTQTRTKGGRNDDAMAKTLTCVSHLCQLCEVAVRRFV